MDQLAKALTALAALAFVLAVVFTLMQTHYLATPEGLSRASTNLALLAIALVLGAGGRRPLAP
jgi:hypothetical protein